jgi:hypothetical protein
MTFSGVRTTATPSTTTSTSPPWPPADKGRARLFVLLGLKEYDLFRHG